MFRGVLCRVRPRIVSPQKRAGEPRVLGLLQIVASPNFVRRAERPTPRAAPERADDGLARGARAPTPAAPRIRTPRPLPPIAAASFRRDGGRRRRRRREQFQRFPFRLLRRLVRHADVLRRVPRKFLLLPVACAGAVPRAAASPREPPVPGRGVAASRAIREPRVPTRVREPARPEPRLASPGAGGASRAAAAPRRPRAAAALRPRRRCGARAIREPRPRSRGGAPRTSSRGSRTGRNGRRLLLVAEARRDERRDVDVVPLVFLGGGLQVLRQRLRGVIPTGISPVDGARSAGRRPCLDPRVREAGGAFGTPARRPPSAGGSSSEPPSSDWSCSSSFWRSSSVPNSASNASIVSALRAARAAR